MITASNPLTKGTRKTSTMTDFSRFLLRKDFSSKGFTNFDVSIPGVFFHIVLEFDVREFEEISLLVKWLSPDSSKFARTFGTANTHDPSLGVKRNGDLLNIRYGRPNMLEYCSKISQKITFLYDLMAIATEIKSAMSNPNYEILFIYFSLPTGVVLIVAKLPISTKQVDLSLRMLEKETK